MDILSAPISRRAFTFGIAAVGGGLVLGLDPQLSSAQSAAKVTSANFAGKPEITIWVSIDPDDTTTILVARSEMGQGNFTSLPMLVAEELECDWARVRAEYVSPADNVNNGRAWGSMVTAASLSIRASQAYLRKAGAQARQMLIEEAAARWNVSPQTCAARNSVVTHVASGRSLRYGELATAASQRPVPENVTLKDPKNWRLIGRPVKRLDTMDKTTGQPIYAMDVRLPNMLYAAVSACPRLGGKLKSFDGARAQGMPGVRKIVAIGGNAVAVAADTWWHAKKALEAVSIVWEEEANPLSSESLHKLFMDGLSSPDQYIGHKMGDVEAALKGAASVITADYEVPYLAHATMEPQNLTAHVTADHAEIWAPTQNGEGTLRTVAATLGLAPSQVVVHKCHLGGGFGRRGLAQDWARMGALIGKAVGQPVKMVWSREEDIQHDYYRPSVVARHTAGFDKQGKLVAWKVRLSGSSISVSLAKNRLIDGQDPEMMLGFVEEDMKYGVPNYEVGYAMRNTPVPVGFWRGVNHSQNGFFREAFVDEMAHAHGKDPYQYRRDLLAHSPRSLAVLDEAAKRAGWGKRAKGVYQGIALVECYNSATAYVVEIKLGNQGEVKVQRVVCAIDPGYVVNSAIVKAQMESAVAFALSAALYGKITLKEGKVEQSNFHDYQVLRMGELPAVETYFVESGTRYSKEWGGVGEPGVPPLAPALVNAIFAATGRRIRSLPLSDHKLA